MATVLGRNEATNPVPRAKSAQWTRSVTGTMCDVGGQDSRGNPATGVHVEGGTYAAHTPLTGMPPGSTVAVTMDVKQLRYVADTNLIAALVMTQDDPATVTEGNPAAALILTPLGALTRYDAELIVPAGMVEGYLRLAATTSSGTMDLQGVRVNYGAPDELGIFTGDTADTEEIAYRWAGDPLASPSIAEAVGAEPDPDPEPDPAGPLAKRVARNLGREGDTETIALAAEHVEIVMEYARGYTRGRGFNGDTPSRGIAAVIVAAASKLTSNPEQVSSYQTGDYSERGAVLNGWTLNQLSVLNTYRKRQS